MTHSPTTSEMAVFGSFGYGNLGDELVPDCLNALMRSLGNTVPLTPLSRFKSNLPMQSVMPMDAARRWLQSKGPTRVIITGGGIIEPRPMSCMNRAFAMAEGQSHVALNAFAVSVEPGIKFGFRDRKTLARQLDHLGPVAVRDDLSARVLTKLAPDHPIRTVGDIALWSHAGDIPNALAAMSADPGIVVILQTTWPQNEVFPWLIGELVDLARSQKLPITVLPFSVLEAADIEIHADLVAQLEQAASDITVFAPAKVLPAAELTHEIAATILGRAKLCISTRLHGCVTAFSQRTPFVALAYHPKLKGFAETVNCQHALLPSAPPAQQTKGTYGYSFGDLGLKKGDLVAKSEVMLSHDDFSAINFYRQRQQETLLKMLG